MTDVLQALIDLVPNAQLEHPQYIEGTLYITRRQLDIVVSNTSAGTSAHMTMQHMQQMKTYYAFGSLPVHVLDPGVPVQLPSGKVVVYSLALGSLCVVNAELASLFATAPVATCPDCRRPPPAEWCWEQSPLSLIHI